jgi:hypothetical protein
MGAGGAHRGGAGFEKNTSRRRPETYLTDLRSDFDLLHEGLQGTNGGGTKVKG